MTVPRQLDYGTAPRWHRRRWPWRLALLLLLAGLAFAAYRWSRPRWPQITYLYWQERCLRYSADPGFVVYEEDVTRAAPLLARGAPYQGVTSLSNPASAGLHGPPAGHVPPPLARLGRGWVCVAFLHERHTPSGKRRLGFVGFQVHGGGGDGGSRIVQIYGSGKTLAGLTMGSRLQGSALHTLHLDLGRADRLRLFAGQPDPADRSRFTMAYDLNGQRGTIEGRLGDDDNFTYRLLDGPLAPNGRRRDDARPSPF